MDFLRLIRYKNLFMVLLTMFLTKYALIDSQTTTISLSYFDFSLLSFEPTEKKKKYAKEKILKKKFLDLIPLKVFLLTQNLMI